MTAIDDLGDVIDQLHDRRERKVTVLRRDAQGHAQRSVSHTVPYDPIKLTELGISLLDGVHGQTQGDPADAHILRAGWQVDFAEAASAALADAGQHMAAGQLAMAAQSARQALAEAGVEFPERKR